MDTEITYTNHLGASMTFGGNDRSLNYLAHGLRDYAWSYSMRGGRATAFSRKMREVPFPVGFAADDEERGVELRNELLALTEPDVIERIPGTVTIGGYSIKCYVIASTVDRYWMSGRFAEFALTLLVEDPAWVRETTLRFVPETATSEAGTNDFPFDFPLEFKRERQSRRVPNASLGPCPFLWRVYGPATNPYIRIGQNLHKVNVSVAEGSRLEVDTQAKTILVIDGDGVGENAYDARERGARGSGSYVFEPLPKDGAELAWDNTFAFDLVLRDVRSAPVWR